MKERAKAAVLTAARQIEIQEFALPAVGLDDGLLRVEACGVCEADVPPFRGNSGGADVALPIQPPVILGHEIVGTIIALGAAAARRWNVDEGDRVAVERWLPCGHCEYCYDGRHRLCRASGAFYGGTSAQTEPGLWGGYAECLYLHPNSLVHKVDASTPAQVWTLLTPISNGISWVSRIGGCTIGSTVVVEGPGQEGLGAVIASREAGADCIVVTGLERDSSRLAKARELGATGTVVVRETVEETVDAIRAVTQNRKVDLVLDVTSGPAADPIEVALEVADVGGRVILAGGHGGTSVSSFIPDRVRMKMLSLHGVRGRDRASLKSGIAVVGSGRYPLESLCTDVLSLDEVELALRIVGREVDTEAVHVCIQPE